MTTILSAPLTTEQEQLLREVRSRERGLLCYSLEEAAYRFDGYGQGYVDWQTVYHLESEELLAFRNQAAEGYLHLTEAGELYLKELDRFDQVQAALQLTGDAFQPTQVRVKQGGFYPSDLTVFRLDREGKATGSLTGDGWNSSVWAASIYSAFVVERLVEHNGWNVIK